MQVLERKWATAKELATPFLLTAAIVIVDQVTKALIVRTIPPNSVGASLFGNFLWIMQSRNQGIAFSIGYGLPDALRRVLFVAFPLLVIVLVLYYYFRSTDLSRGVRWSLAGIVGGGIGNLIDRVFRPQGVVDFLSVKFYGILGMSRWPVFNLADSSVVVCGILLVFFFIFQEGKEDE